MYKKILFININFLLLLFCIFILTNMILLIVILTNLNIIIIMIKKKKKKLLKYNFYNFFGLIFIVIGQILIMEMRHLHKYSSYKKKILYKIKL